MLHALATLASFKEAHAIIQKSGALGSQAIGVIAYHGLTGNETRRSLQALAAACPALLSHKMR